MSLRQRFRRVACWSLEEGSVWYGRGPKAWKLKEWSDRVVAAGMLLLLAPLLLVIAVAIKIDSRGPILYCQNRVGRFERCFRILKFRTMIANADWIGLGLGLVHDDKRITRVGAWIRRASLDELAQLINVVKGDMSLVGPRPGLPDQCARYNRRQRRRLRVKPGITGWAQINGRNTISWEERIEYDLWYIRNWSLLLDLYILLRTVGVVLNGEGLYGKGGVNWDLGEIQS